jgi:hypothetical protein
MSQRQVTKHDIVETAQALCNLMAIPRHSQHSSTLAGLDVFGLRSKYPSAFWDVLGNAISPDVQEEVESRIQDWAALVKIIAVCYSAQLLPTALGQSLGSALRVARINRIQLLTLVGAPTREDFRLFLVRCVHELTKARIAFPIDEVAELLLLDGADREQAHKKLAGDCAI